MATDNFVFGQRPYHDQSKHLCIHFKLDRIDLRKSEPDSEAGGNNWRFKKETFLTLPHLVYRSDDQPVPRIQDQKEESFPFPFDEVQSVTLYLSGSLAGRPKVAKDFYEDIHTSFPSITRVRLVFLVEELRGPFKDFVGVIKQQFLVKFAGPVRVRTDLSKGKIVVEQAHGLMLIFQFDRPARQQLVPHLAFNNVCSLWEGIVSEVLDIPDVVRVRLDKPFVCKQVDFQRLVSRPSIKSLLLWEGESSREVYPGFHEDLGLALVPRRLSGRKKRKIRDISGVGFSIGLCHLQTLQLQGIPFNKDQQLAFCRVIQNNTSIVNLTYDNSCELREWDNASPRELWGPLLNILEHNKTLQRLTLYGFCRWRLKYCDYSRAELLNILQNYNSTLHKLTHHAGNHSHQIESLLERNYYGLGGFLRLPPDSKSDLLASLVKALKIASEGRGVDSQGFYYNSLPRPKGGTREYCLCNCLFQLILDNPHPFLNLLGGN